MIIKLVVEKAEGLTLAQVVEIERAETVVGRHRDCHLRIPSADVSRRHCILRLLEGILSIEDLGSMNGSYLNGERIIGLRNVRDGDKLEIGPVTFAVHYYQPAKHVTQVKPDTVKVTTGAATVSEESKTAQVKSESPTVEQAVKLT